MTDGPRPAPRRATGLIPPRLRAWAVSQQRKYRLQWPRRGSVDFGHLRRVTPISTKFGFDRGRPIDRYYIERFLRESAQHIRGRCLELGDAYYTTTLGGERVSQADVLHVVEGNPEATIIADLTNAPHIPSDAFDCIIFTQTLQMIYDMPAALRTLHRILKPGGMLLMTSSGISKVGRRLGRDDWGEYWRLTAQGAEALFADLFPCAVAEVIPYGNVLAAAAYLYGLSLEELAPEELDYVDPDFEVIVAARVRKAGTP